MNRRKVEFWPYTVVECKEAEKHLNKMYMDGYELVGISKSPSLAGYKKVEDSSKKKKYSVIISDVENYVKDDHLIYLDSIEGMSVYCDEEKKHKYYKEEAFTNLKNNLLKKNVKGSKHIMFYYLVLVVLLVMFYKSFTAGNFDDEPQRIFYGIVCILLCFIWLVQGLQSKKSLIKLKGYSSFKNFKDEKYGVYRKRLKAISYFFTGALVLPIVLSIYFEIISDNPGIEVSSIIVIMGVIVVLAATFFTLIKKDYVSKKVLIFLGVIIIVLGLVYGNPY
ncbi:MAG: hypothetical protein JJE03_03275 [Peptostreptococcaceae bacterium]|nr:hypothetical protein [Peptostreptococcaceae bacterium]